MNLQQEEEFFSDVFKDIDPKLIDSKRNPCDKACPLTCPIACGLPECWEIFQWLKQKKVWMCHSNERSPCCVTNLKAVPEGWQPITSEDYNKSNQL